MSLPYKYVAPASEKQKSYIKFLYSKLGQDKSLCKYENLACWKAAMTIKKLHEKIIEKEKFEQINLI